MNLRHLLQELSFVTSSNRSFLAIDLQASIFNRNEKKSTYISTAFKFHCLK